MSLEFPDLMPPAAAPAPLPAVQPVTVKAAVLQLFAPMDADLRALAEKYRAVAYDVATPKGLTEAKAARHDLRENGRFAVQRMRDQAKKALNDGKAAAEAEAERLIAIVQPREDDLDALIKAREDSIAAEKAVEAQRQQKHRDAIATLRNYVAQAQAKAPSAERLAAGIAHVEAIDVSAQSFEEFAVEAAVVKADTIAALRELHARAVEAEQVRAENERRQRVINAIASVQEQLSACVGETSEAVAERIALMERTVYSEELGAEVVKAHEGALAQMRKMHAAALEHEALKRQWFAARAEERRREQEAQAEQERAAAQAAEAATITEQLATGQGQADGCRASECQPDGCSGPVSQDHTSLPAPPTTLNSAAQAPQQVLKAEAETPDATGRGAPVIASPVGGPTGAGQPAAAGPADGAELPDFSIDLGALETSEREAVEPGPIVLYEPLPTGDAIDLQDLLGNALELVRHVQQAFGTSFPTQPKMGPEWWAVARTLCERLAPELQQAVAEVCS